MSRQFGDYDAGLMAVLGEGSGATRYTVGFNDGTKLMVRKVSLLRHCHHAQDADQSRSSRSLCALCARAPRWCSSGRSATAWEKLHREAISADTPAVAGGLFLATEQAAVDSGRLRLRYVDRSLCRVAAQGQCAP